MVVIAIIAIGVTIASRVFSRGVRGNSETAFARGLLAAVQDARHTAISLGRTTRMVVDITNGAVETSTYDPTTAAWGAATTLTAPRKSQLCTPKGSVDLGTTVTPTCPTTGTPTICFAPNGRVTFQASSTLCPTTSPSTGTGATIYFGSNSTEGHYRIVIWGLTGMSKIIDRW